MLDSLDGRALRSYHKPDYSVRDSYLNRHVAWNGSWWAGGRAQQGAQRALAGGTDLGEMLGGREYLALRAGHVLLAPRYHEHWLLAAHRGLDVSVGLRSECFDFTTCNQTGNDRLDPMFLETGR